MENFLPRSEVMLNFSFGLLIILIIVLAILIKMLIFKLIKLKEFVVKEKIDLTATVISLVIIAMCIGGILAYLFFMSAMIN